MKERSQAVAGEAVVLRLIVTGTPENIDKTLVVKIELRDQALEVLQEWSAEEVIHKEGSPLFSVSYIPPYEGQFHDWWYIRMRDGSKIIGKQLFRARPGMKGEEDAGRTVSNS